MENFLLQILQLSANPSVKLLKVKEVQVWVFIIQCDLCDYKNTRGLCKQETLEDTGTMRGALIAINQQSP